jgi:hypothetical protein
MSASDLLDKLNAWERRQANEAGRELDDERISSDLQIELDDSWKSIDEKLVSDIRLANGRQEKVFVERANVMLVGDRVNLFADQPGASFGWGTVVCVTEDEVEIVRPFVHVGEYTGAGRASPVGPVGTRLLSYIGQEVTRLPRHSDRTYTVVFRASVPR